MSSAVQDLQKAIVGGSQSLTQLLRQTKLIAAKLNLDDVERWADLELGGYPGDKEPPDYRKFTTYGIEIRNPLRGWEFAGHYQRSDNAHQPIAELETFSKGEALHYAVKENFRVRDSIGGSMGSDWPQRVIIPASEFNRILEAVRNELLQWSIDLEKRGIRGESMNFDDTEKKTASSLVFNIQKFAGVIGNANNSQVTHYDYSSVQTILVEHGIPKQDRRELEDIMDELKEATPDKRPSLLKRAEDWITNHKRLLGSAAELIGKAIDAAMKG